ncbi:MAG: alpha/beta hydrolase [Pararhodobacter sp.]|nr:alpha/beta hydrolase [Pararhodobacter sp.]
MQEHRIPTAGGSISCLDSATDGPVLLLIHGNSSCKAVFRAQFASDALAGFRLVAPDLPGHGASDDATDPAATYTFGGYAAAIQQVMAALAIERPVVFGWSLGGHVALELAGRGTPLAGVMISGAPPVKPELPCLMAAFNIDPAAENLTGKRDFSEDDAQAYALHTAGVDGQVDPHLLAMVRRTDGRAREIMFGSVVTGAPLDEQAIVASMTMPLAVLNGADDPFIQHAYFDTLAYATLWSHGIMALPGAGHAPFLQQPEAFNAHLAAFATDCHR